MKIFSQLTHQGLDGHNVPIDVHVVYLLEVSLVHLHLVILLHEIIGTEIT